MHWQQITFIVLVAVSGTVALVQHGKPRDGYYNFIAWLIATGLELWLLYSGGFFGG